jgi:hypothetical protein
MMKQSGSEVPDIPHLGQAPTARRARGRRVLVWILAAGVLGSPLAAGAQQHGRVARLGVLSAASPTEHVYTRLPAALRELGYVEGRNP